MRTRSSRQKGDAEREGERRRGRQRQRQRHGEGVDCSFVFRVLLCFSVFLWLSLSQMDALSGLPTVQCARSCTPLSA